MKKHVTNTIKNWNEIKEALEEKLSTGELSEFSVEIDMSCDDGKEEGDILNLQNMFYIVDFCRNHAGFYPKFNINLDKAHSEFAVKSLQIQQYLYIQLTMRKSVIVSVNGKPINGQLVRFGRLQPIMVVNKMRCLLFSIRI